MKFRREQVGDPLQIQGHFELRFFNLSGLFIMIDE